MGNVVVTEPPTRCHWSKLSKKKKSRRFRIGPPTFDLGLDSSVLALVHLERFGTQ